MSHLLIITLIRIDDKNNPPAIFRFLKIRNAQLGVVGWKVKYQSVLKYVGVAITPTPSESDIVSALIHCANCALDL